VQVQGLLDAQAVDYDALDGSLQTALRDLARVLHALPPSQLTAATHAALLAPIGLPATLYMPFYPPTDLAATGAYVFQVRLGRACRAVWACWVHLYRAPRPCSPT